MICLAVAGLKRLGLEHRITERLDPDWFVPDPGQGAVAVEARIDDARVMELLKAIHDAEASTTTRAERAFLAAVGGSCQTPIGASAVVVDGELSMRVMLATSGVVRLAEVKGDVDGAIAAIITPKRSLRPEKADHGCRIKRTGPEPPLGPRDGPGAQTDDDPPA